MRKSLKSEVENIYGKWLDSATDRPNQSLLKHWEEVKQSMNCWTELATVSRNTERQFDKKISARIGVFENQYG